MDIFDSFSVVLGVVDECYEVLKLEGVLKVCLGELERNHGCHAWMPIVSACCRTPLVS